MVAITFALALAQTPPMPKAPPMSFTTEVRGYGDRVEHNARVTVHFVAKTEGGTLLADTEKRGMPFTFLMGQDTVKGFWHQSVENARVGDVRTIRIAGSAVGMPIEGDPVLVLTIRVVKVARL